MLANELIDRLERRGLLDQEIIEALRQQLSEGGARVTPEAVAKLLVDNGQLTKFQASKLIGELRSDDYDDAEDVVELTDDMEVMELVGDEMNDDVVDVFEDDSDIVEAEAVEAEPVMVEAEPVQAEAVEAVGERPVRRSPNSRVKPPEHKSVWDSFKVYGYVGIILFLILAAFLLTFVLGKQSAEDVIASANKQYDSQSYQPAQDSYISFLASFGQDNQYSSLARVRITMCELYRGAQMTDPTKALDLAKEKLPGIVDEEGMNEERGNLAALLVDIAENIANEASKATVTSEKQALLDKLDEQWTLIDDPNYMLASMKTTLEGRLLQITEARNRVKRDIDRNIRLDETEAGMQAALKDQNTKEAYDLRKSLLRDFPELAVDERLTVLIQEASDIQKTLVKLSNNKPQPSTEVEQDATLKSIVLTTRQGKSIAGLERDIFYLRAGGSVFAFSAFDGRLLWRQFTGYGENHTPIRLEDGDAVLLSDIKTNEVRHCRGEDGELQWRSSIDEPFVEPVAGKDSILISAKSGRLLSLDSDSGDPNWVAELPQPLTTPAGLDDRLRRVYVPGNHSNLYALDSRTGKCLESFYIGHEEDTISVAPISLLGHLFVIENAGADYAQVHVLRMDEQGGNLKVAQPPFRLTGNVLVPPVIQQRRMIVLTDRGQVAVYDIEPTAERQQVSRIAEQVASYDTPTLTRMAVGRSQMWITGTRVGRYELQINTGRVVYDWGKAEGDMFVGQPLAFEDALIHARILRGTSAIRVTGAEPKTGRELWRTDVGTPISMLAQTDTGFHAVTSQGALFELDRESLAAGSTQGPIENPGADSIKMNFNNPIELDKNRRVLLNQSQRGEAMIYDPNRRSEKLRKITFNLTGPKPTGVGIFSGEGIFLPLDSGRAVVMDWQTGTEESESQSKSSPFQPLSDPTATVSWTNPVLVDGDRSQVVIADSRKKIYRLRVDEQIKQVEMKDLDVPFLGRAVGFDQVFIGGANGPAADFLIGYEMNGLNQKFKKLLDGRIAWGPSLATSDNGDSLALVITNDSILRGFASDGSQTFETPMPVQGLPINDVVSIEGNWILTGRDGWLIAIDPSNGSVRGTTELGQPLSASPLPVGNRLLVPGREGVVYITNIPGQ
ncbi:Outer membrane protein assembly factor BamB, contains PQQ-like beta-propeller repeat [Neorhodopirellula lusitana]|uniref:Outer membrane protein assembly factor BamB, contains PQQ-like beta-propeller repeat n=1 Tax=Neorhodopirellula lusitana TaxID=445327 RepID=A0ABY1Q1R1_9BACT|nr:PQQ-binding-like beta-propeller repeat protein [Neorhodopirellula lusitana]SMP56526.1 Outer membrane protein assembly factor BamB, contains PQQ-like beta-propeller repeat [Neorhodopirellula lusitana]